MDVYKVSRGCPVTVTTYKSVSAILVSPNPKVVITVNGIATSALGGMLFDFI